MSYLLTMLAVALVTAGAIALAQHAHPERYVTTERKVTK